LDDGIAFVAVDPSDGGAVTRELADAHVLLTTQFDKRMAAACRVLELLICPAAGTEGIDRSVLPPAVEVKSGTGHEIPMAEYAIGALVALRQRFREADGALRRGDWRFGYFGSRAMVDELQGSTLGIVGFGRIGAELARRAAAFGIRCDAVTLHPEKHVAAGTLANDPGSIARTADVDRLLENADAIVIACELSELTRGLIDARRFGLMRSNALLVNIARGPIVEERALFEALQSRKIAGAAIDVWYRYPDEGSHDAKPSVYPFETLDNVLMTPHSSAWTAGAKRRKLEFLAGCINDYFEKKRPAAKADRLGS
jgi:phosphoglycerate dehydrogenase-like enzyme